MTTEREMLEYAAKACGIEIINIGFVGGPHIKGTTKQWNPKDNSADCAAMCAKLFIHTRWIHEHGYIDATHGEFRGCEYFKDHNNDRETAWRYAACKVAEAIGRAMK